MSREERRLGKVSLICTIQRCRTQVFYTFPVKNDIMIIERIPRQIESFQEEGIMVRYPGKRGGLIAETAGHQKDCR